MSVKRLGPIGAMILVAGNMIGSGVYLLPATLGATGSITIVSWLIATGGALALALVYANLGLLRPNADGAVAYAAEGLNPLLGHMGWFVYWVSCWGGSSAVVVAATGYLAFFFPVLKTGLPAMACTIALLWLCAGIAAVGPRLAARVSGLTLVLGLLPIILTIVAGVFAFQPELFAQSWNVSGKPALTAVTTAVAPIFWAYLGLESANVCAAVVDNPRRNLPIAAVGGVLLAAVIYTAASAAIMGLMPAADLAASSAPFADAIKGVAGAGAAGLVAACAFLKTIGTFGGWSLLGAEANRSGAAAGFLPHAISAVAPDRRPIRDLVFMGVLMSLSIVASASKTLGAQFGVLINVAVIFSMVLYLLGAAALLRLASGLERPVLRLGARAAAILGGGFSLWLILTMDPAMRLPTAVSLAAAVLFYGVHLLWRRRRAAVAAAG